MREVLEEDEKNLICTMVSPKGDGGCFAQRWHSNLFPIFAW